MPLERSIIDETLRTEQGERAYKVCETLHDAGYDTWWVGGCVRDMLLGRVPEDIDIATAATPEQVCALFRRNDPNAAKMGSVRVIAGPHILEITTFREDDEASDGRHPESIIYADRSRDAKRRDFTINAIYWHPISGEIDDPFDGQGDLKEKLIRFIGEPAIRIKHDALRMLRAVRFRAALMGQYHPDTYAALREHATHIEVLSGTRMLGELEKMLALPHPDRALEDLWELSILRVMIPELEQCKGIPQPADYHHEGDVWEHTLACTRAFEPWDDGDVRLAALFHDCGKAETFSRKERIRFDEHASVSADTATTVLMRLQCPRKRIQKIDWLIRHHMMMAAFFEMSDERKTHWYFHPWFPDLLELFRLDIAGTTPSDYSFLDRILKDYHQFLDKHPRPIKPLLNGTEIMELLGLERGGERVGELLQMLHDAQVRGEVTSREEARAFLQNNGKDTKKGR